jgi:CubicO group peptidase (beta-lactamase class C family)
LEHILTSRNINFAVLVLSTALWCVSITARTDELLPPTFPSNKVLVQELSSELNQLHKKELFDGTILIWTQEQTLFERSYGYANRSKQIKNTANTISDIGSIAKTFTAAAILILIEEGKLNLDDSLGEIFPNSPSDKKLLTIKSLLSHSSGLDNFHNETDFDEMSKQEAIEKILNLSMVGKQDEKIAYSNAAYTLLAAIVEKVSGGNFQSYVRKHLLGPLKLKNTGFYGDQHFHISRLARGYGGSDTGKTTFEKGLTWALVGQGGMVSSANDLAIWFDAIVSGRIFPKSTDNMMLSKANDKWMLGNIRYFSSWGAVSYYAGGSTDFGYTASAHYLPDSDVFIVVLFNSYIDGYGNATHHKVAKNHIFPLLLK